MTRDSSACIKTPDKYLSSSMLLMVNSIRGRILLIVCDIFLRKEAENRHFGRYTKTAVIRSRSSKVIDFGTTGKCVYVHIPISDQ